MSKRMLVLMCSIFLIVPLLFMGCGNDGAAGAPGAPGAPGGPGGPGDTGQDLTATPNPESCAVCHGTAGNQHQASYDALYQDNVIVVTGLAYAFDNNNDVVSFKLTKAGLPLSGKVVQNLNIYFTGYDSATRRFNVPGDLRLSIKGTPANITYDVGTNTSTSSKASADNVSLSGKNGLIVVYGYDESTGYIPGSRVQQAKYNYAALLPTGAGVNYVSAANVAGCEKCHMKNYVKHGNIPGRVSRNDNTQFYTCKSCHLDNGPGSDFIWQMLVNDPAAAVAIENGGDYTSAQETQYAYKTSLMNDVHMSHAMEFEYPQSMANCATCHEGKLDRILTDNNFTLETCKSCHPVTGSAKAEKPQPALEAIIPHVWTAATDCKLCHTAGTSGIAPVFSAIHTGYDKKIYGDSAGTKYSAAITVTIDNASFVGNQLTFGFSAAGSLGGLSAANIKPTVLVGLYGWNTKDFVIGPHESTVDTSRNLEYLVGATHPRFTTVLSAGGHWTVTANLSTWADNIVAGNIKRVEIAVMPKLLNADNVVVALNAPSKTFDLGTKAFVDFYPAIVKVPTGCNNCHDALATTFHSADRGGNIVVCRLCHITKSGGSHLEMQSRSIDSYAHAIHSFQAFDISGIDFADPVEAMFYELKIGSHYPTFGIKDCQSCHNAGTYNVPDQAKSLPGVFSASKYPISFDNIVNRNIGTVPSYVAGPASRACGACHRAEMINEDDEVALASFNSHTRTNGYLLENADILKVIYQVMSNYEEIIVDITP